MPVCMEGSNKLDLHCLLWVRESLQGEVVRSGLLKTTRPLPDCQEHHFTPTLEGEEPPSATPASPGTWVVAEENGNA